MATRDVLGQLFEKTPLAFSLHKVIFDNQGKPVDYVLLETNPTFKSRLGFSDLGVVGKRMSEWLLASGEIRKKWFEAFGEVVLTGGRKEFSEALECKGQWYRPTAFVPYPDHLVILFHHAIEPKKPHDEFVEAKTSLPYPILSAEGFSKSVFDNAPVAIIVYEVRGDGSTSQDYIFRKINPAALIMEGFSAEEVIGKTLGAVRPAADEFGIIDVFQRVWRTGKTAHYPAQVYKEANEHRWFENTVFKLPTGEIVAVYSDVTEKKVAEEQLFAEKERLRVTLYSIGDGVITTDPEGRIEMLNGVSEVLTGWKQEEATGLPLATVFDIYNEVTGRPCKNPVDLVLQNGTTVGLANHTVLKSKSGIVSAIADSAAPIKNERGEILGVVLVFRDVTAAKAKEAKIEFLSYRDTLTGLYNRAYFEEELKRLDQGDQFPLMLIMADLNGLKLVNDVFGHQVGDEALIKTAEIFKESCRGTDTISRWGGDEFVILLPETPAEVGQQICDRIKKSFNKLVIADTKLSISLGHACKTTREEKWEDILKCAEDNMYKGKLLGEKSYRSTIVASIKNTLFEKNCETEEHGERLGRFCRKIGKSMGLSSTSIDELELLATLHDIGKIAIDDRILLKAGPLTEGEWKVVKKHPEIGYRIAQTVPELLYIAEYILAHHERWDGKGYPRGLTGEEIPLLSRILAVVDAYDAMTRDRPYREALPIEKAKEELQKNAGKQFDPRIVNIFLTHLEKNEDIF